MRKAASAVLQAQPAPSCPVHTVAREATTHSYDQKKDVEVVNKIYYEV